MAKLVNRAKMTTATTGTGTITLGSAVDGYQTFASAGVNDADVVRYVIEDGLAWEIGTGTYTASGTTLSRTVSESSNADAAINLSGTATVFVGATAEDFAAPSGPTLQAIASGALSDGSTVVINADGTVSVVAVTVFNPPEVGTPVVFESAATFDIYSTYDSENQKVVIAYRDNGNSNFGTAVVGTVSGTSISFGTPVVFEIGATVNISAIYDSFSQKVVIAYSDNGNSGAGTVVVGTVSGASISFGTPVLFNNSGTFSGVSATYDSFSQKVVIAFSNGGNLSRGTAVVGTVSGTSISFGTPVVFEIGATVNISAIYDSFSQKVVIAYRDNGNSNFGTAVVGTVSGTSISFGTPVVFSSTTTFPISATYDSDSQKVVVAFRQSNTNSGTVLVGTVSGTSISFGTPVVFGSIGNTPFSAIYDSDSQKVVIAYPNRNNSNFGTAIAGTVSGTSISFGTPVVFESASTLNGISATYDSFSQKVVIAYTDDGNSNFGTAAVFQNETSNLTAENFIGFSDAAYADTATATIQLVGAVDDAQTSLTAGQKYYVQKDGTLSTSPDTPSVYAGLAVASDKIIVKG